MAWCPECRYEFVDGVKECPKCHVPLVESLDTVDRKKEEVFSVNPDVEELLEDSDRREMEYSAEIDPAREDAIGLTDQEKARAYYGRTGAVYIKPYQSKAQKAEDAKSSGIAMVLVGACILLFSVLWAFDLLPIRMKIRMTFFGLFAICAFYFLIGGCFSHTEYFIVITFIRQFGSPLDTDCYSTLPSALTLPSSLVEPG